MITPCDAPDMLSADFQADPYPAYREMRENFPLIWHEPTQSYIISRYDDVAHAFKNPAFTTRNYEWQLEPVHGGPTIMQMTGREHSVRRALVAPAFRGKELETRFLPVIDRNSRELIDRFRHAGSVDLASEFSAHFPVNIIVDMLGLDKSDHPKFHRWYTSVVRFFGNITGDPEILAEGERTRDEFAEHMLPIIRERRANPGDDLLSSLCMAEVEGTRMSDHDIKSFCSLLLAAGGETTDKMVTAIFANLLRNPEQLAAVRADHSLITQTFVEALRYSPPVHMIIRQLEGEDAEFSGGVVPDGSKVICVLAAANRDSSRYSEPDTFNIFREEISTTTAFSAAANHMSFALGRHFCVGSLLAKSEVEIAVSQLLDAMPDVALADGHTPTEEGLFTRGIRSLPLRFTPREAVAA